jgi:hypothetical protein
MGCNTPLSEFASKPALFTTTSHINQSQQTKLQLTPHRPLLLDIRQQTALCRDIIVRPKYYKQNIAATLVISKQIAEYVPRRKPRNYKISVAQGKS